MNCRHQESLDLHLKMMKVIWEDELDEENLRENDIVSLIFCGFENPLLRNNAIRDAFSYLFPVLVLIERFPHSNCNLLQKVSAVWLSSRDIAKFGVDTRVCKTHNTKSKYERALPFVIFLVLRTAERGGVQFDWTRIERRVHGGVAEKQIGRERLKFTILVFFKYPRLLKFLREICPPHNHAPLLDRYWLYFPCACVCVFF